MNYEEKCHFALKELTEAKIWESNYNPPIIKLLRKFGFKVPFPHYNSFLMNALSTGLYFSCLWGLLMCFSRWNTQNISLYDTLSTALFAGTLFGVAMASYYRHGFKKYKLTPWHEIK
ncbi:hypothetical protein PALB_9650 [Pseudoalteromonas luteoviolacea B = ATCC 29581]|nr:hypothetical protein PALB_9650 [Pseudoalteromonas luteoviolacea B = ATCC 29581]